jgi:selenocysteine lyase/cysteine desulfurase
MEAVNELTSRIESNVDLFHRIEYAPLLLEARKQVAELIGAETDEVVFVLNASMGVTTVLRNFEWEDGDIIFACMSLDLSYLEELRGRRAYDIH